MSTKLQVLVLIIVVLSMVTRTNYWLMRKASFILFMIMILAVTLIATLDLILVVKIERAVPLTLPSKINTGL